ncbi:MAG: response regulator [Magnetovibrio sp.]|nr:response regulator [Magnetovibrio sp.]
MSVKANRILVIDDDEDIVAYLCTILEEHNYVVDTAFFADEGLERVEAKQPDLILCDINMPEKDGIWFVSEFRRRYPELIKTPVCYLTVKSERDDLIEGLRSGVDAYLTKPIDKDILLTTIAARLKHVEKINNAPLPGKMSPKVFVAAIAVATTSFILDIAAPLGVQGGVLYALLVLVGWWFHSRTIILYLAIVSSILTVVGYFLASLSSFDAPSITNRVYAIVIIWAIALVIWRTWPERTRSYKHSVTEKMQKGDLSEFFSRETILVTIMVIVIAVSSWGILVRVQSEARRDIANSLRTALETSHQSIRAQWADLRKTAKTWASNKLVQIDIKELLSLPVDAETLRGSQAQADLREWMLPIMEHVGYRGFFIINENNINLASSRDSNVGFANLLSTQGDFLDRVRAGETLVSLPLPSDVPLKDRMGKIIAGLDTMFVATPIQDDMGNTLAILAFRLEPDDYFMPIFQRGYAGETGETYAFDKNGTLISESRFNDQLRKIGLITGDHSDLNIEIRDPGVNMTLGHKSLLERSKQPLTLMAQQAISGKNGSDLKGYNDYRGVTVVGSWLWDDELGFGITSEIDFDEAYASYISSRFIIIGFAVLTISIFVMLVVASASSRRRIQESEGKFHKFYDIVPDVFMITSLETGNCVDVNNGFSSTTGYAREDVIGKNMLDFQFWENNDDRFQLVKKLKESGVVSNFSANFKRRNGTIWPGMMSACLIKLNNEDHILSSTTDVSEIHETQQQALEANQAKSDFLSSMSHELRTPMNAILGFAQMLEYNPEEPLSEHQKESVGHILKGGQHLLELINEVLDLAKIESGKVKLSIEEVAIKDIVDEILPLINELAKKKNIDISLTSSFEYEGVVRADHIRFKQSALNLLSNAVKYNRTDGQVTVDCKKTSRGMLRLSIADTGKGIAPEMMDQLFQPFSRLGQENSEIEGTGIGLTITKKLIEAMGGRLGVHSEVGVGSTFWIELPLSERKFDDEQYQIAQISSISKQMPNIDGVVLYVEDNPANLQLMVMIIERIDGLTMISAHTAELGIALALERRPDMIILDINLPGMDGYEALKQLKAQEQTKDIPVIALSANAMSRDIEKGIEAGFQQYLTKPIKVEDVVNSIKNIIQQGM